MILLLAFLAAQSAEAPILAGLPEGADPNQSYRLVREEDDKELSLQKVGKSELVWIDGLSQPGVKRRYRLEEGISRAGGGMEYVYVVGSHVTPHVLIRSNGRDLLRYNAGIVRPPAGVDEVYSSSGYIHPVWTPAGRIVTHDFAAKHEHHHGIWLCWRKCEFEGRPFNAWSPLEKQGKVENKGAEEIMQGAVYAGFRSRQRFVDLTAPSGSKSVLEDVWQVRAYDVRRDFMFDLESTQTCVGESPLTILKSPYGGLGFRGSREWEGKEGVKFLTSEGRTRADGDGMAARWVVMNGKIGGQEAGIALLCHPSNFRAPQATRLAPESPFFCWVPSHSSEFQIEPGKPFVSRYRFIVADRALTAAEIDRHWDHYAKPSQGIVLTVK